MKKAIVFSLLVIGASSCVKLSKGYYCKCAIVYKSGGSGTFTGAQKTQGDAEADCQDKKTGLESNGHIAECQVLQK